MADAQNAPTSTTETPTVETLEAPANDTYVDPVDAGLERLGAEGTPANDAEATETDAKQETESKPEPKPQAELEATDEALFSEQALSTPEGVQAAAARVRELKAQALEAKTTLEKRQHKLDRFELAIKNRERKFTKTKEEHLTWHSQQRDQARMLGQHIQVLRTGSANQILDSLGFLTGRDANAVWEDLVQGATGTRKQANPEIAALREEFRQYRESVEQERQQHRQHSDRSQKQAAIEQWGSQILTAASNAETYPTLARYVAARPQEIAEELLAMKRTYRQQYGEVLSDENALIELDDQLARLLSQQPGGGTGSPRTPQSGVTNPGGQSAQSQQAKRVGIAGIPPSASAKVPAIREETEDERRQALTQEDFQALGLW